MKIRRFGALIAVVGAVYLVTIAWMSSWWYVPALSELGPGAFIERVSPAGAAFSIIWASSGVLGAIIVAFGAAVYSAVGRLRLLLLAAGGALLFIWLAFWSSSSHNAAVFGVGGGLILLCFLTSCLDWARTRRDLDGSSMTASDLRLAAHVSFFIAAWGLCGGIDRVAPDIGMELGNQSSGVFGVWMGIHGSCTANRTTRKKECRLNAVCVAGS